jgi:hypothetical protein
MYCGSGSPSECGSRCTDIVSVCVTPASYRTERTRLKHDSTKAVREPPLDRSTSAFQTLLRNIGTRPARQSFRNSVDPELHRVNFTNG